MNTHPWPGYLVFPGPLVYNENMSRKIQYWLMKSEPDVYSLDDLKRDKISFWDGVRNFQARNFMRDDMRVGDRVLFYHSNATPPGVAGIARVSHTARPDLTAVDSRSPYFDPKSGPHHPIWVGVEIAFVQQFEKFVPLHELKKHRSQLKDLLVIRRGMRLSIQPVKATDFEFISSLGHL